MSENQMSVIGDNNALLALLNEGGAGKFATNDALKEVAGSGLRYLPYVQIANATSTAVTNRKTGIGTLFLTQNKEVFTLNESFIAVLLAWRPKAMQYSPEPKSYYDPKSPSFQEIQRLSDMPDSGKSFGVEFLIWIPERELFATFFFGSKTGRNEVPNVIALLNAGKINVRFRAVLIQNKSKRSWYSAVAEAADGPVHNMPTVDALKTVLDTFKNPPATDDAPAEKAEESSRD